jgi:hypothetical protein
MRWRRCGAQATTFCHPERSASPSPPPHQSLARSEGSTARNEWLVVARRPPASPVRSFARRKEYDVRRWLRRGGSLRMTERGGRGAPLLCHPERSASQSPPPHQSLARSEGSTARNERLVVARRPPASPARSFARRKEYDVRRWLRRGGSLRMTERGGAARLFYVILNEAPHRRRGLSNLWRAVKDLLRAMRDSWSAADLLPRRLDPSLAATTTMCDAGSGGAARSG